MRDHLREKVTFAYVYGGLTPEFVHSLAMLIKYDNAFGKRLSDDWLLTCQTTNIASGRNKIVEQFLAAESKPAWLLFCDTDQVFPYDLIEQMIESADPVERPILSALIMGFRTVGEESMVAPACATIDDDSNIIVPQTVPAVRHWPVGMIGCGCVLIHRSVLEAVGAEWKPRDPYPWFTANMPWKRTDRATGEPVLDAIGEDYAFCLRAAGLGFFSTVDTTIEVGHVKKRVLTSGDFWRENPQAAAQRWAAEPTATAAVIPFKNKWKMTRALVEQIADGTDLVLLFNNGSDQDQAAAAAAFAAKHDNVEVVDARGLGIHEMWNAGVEEALSRFPKVNVAFLNNDLDAGPEMVQRMSQALAEDTENLVAVCPNYDGRDNDCHCGPDHYGPPCGDPVERLHSIYAGGNGNGLAGFCFMVKGEWFQAGYRFPEECMWWFGDNDITMSIDAAGGWYGMVHAATVTHLDGGSQTIGDANDYGSSPQGIKDRQAFMAKWKLVEQLPLDGAAS